MPDRIKDPLRRLLRRSEKYTKLDMVYLASGTAWLNAGRIISLASGMLLTVGFANLLSPDAFGTYKYLIAVAALVGTFSFNTMGSAVQRYVAQNKKNVIPALVRITILSNIPASIVVAGIAVYYFLHGNDPLAIEFLIIAFITPLLNGVGLSKSILLGAGDFKVLTLTGIPRTIIPIALLIATLFVTHNVIYIFLVYMLSNTIASWALYRWSVKHLDIYASPEHVSEAIRFGTHMSVLGFFMLLSGQLDQLLLWHFTSPATLAVYALALAPASEAKNFLDNFLSLAFPKIASKGKEEARRILPLRLRQMFLSSIVVTILYILLIPFLFKLLFPKYLASIVVSQVLALLIIFQPRGIIDVLFTAHGEVKSRYSIILISQGVELALFCFLIPVFGLWGAVAGTVLSEAGATIVYIFVYFRGARLKQ